MKPADIIRERVKSITNLLQYNLDDTITINKKTIDTNDLYLRDWVDGNTKYKHITSELLDRRKKNLID